MTAERLRRRDDGTALIEFIWLGLLMLLPLVYVMLTASDVQRAAYGASTASRAAGRAFILAPDAGTGRSQALSAARTALADQGIPAESARVDIECAPAAAGCLTPGSTVTVVVTVRQRLPLAPDVMGESAPAITVDSTHTEPYGTFREVRS